MALVMAIGITTVLGIVGTTALAYSTSDAQQSNQSRSRQSAFSLAESGINNLMSILNLPTKRCRSAPPTRRSTPTRRRLAPRPLPGSTAPTPAAASTTAAPSSAAARSGM